jgi:hypothetical protein
LYYCSYLKHENPTDAKLRGIDRVTVVAEPSIRIKLTLTAEQHRKLSLVAEQRGLSLTALIVQAAMVYYREDLAAIAATAVDADVSQNASQSSEGSL